MLTSPEYNTGPPARRPDESSGSLVVGRSPEGEVRATYSELKAHFQGHINDEVLARMLASWCHGEGAMPGRLGLSPAWFEALMNYHFPAAQLAQPPLALVTDPARSDELDELRRLLMGHRARQSVSEQWIAEIVAVACLGNHHLWQDLGLWSRRDLGAMMRNNFPALAKRNDRDMKWKKFLYKQLCETEGIYTCRSPSCEVCPDYRECFGSEE